MCFDRFGPNTSHSGYLSEVNTHLAEYFARRSCPSCFSFVSADISARNNVKDNAAKIYEMSDIGKVLYSTDSIRDIRAIIELGVANRSSGLSLIFS